MVAEHILRVRVAQVQERYDALEARRMRLYEASPPVVKDVINAQFQPQLDELSRDLTAIYDALEQL